MEIFVIVGANNGVIVYHDSILFQEEVYVGVKPETGS